MNMYKWVSHLIAEPDKKAMPILSYPSAQLMFIPIMDLVTDPRCMAMGMRLIADRYDMPYAPSYMDLSVEAEAFGANCIYQEDEIPTIRGQLIETQEQADALVVPEVGTKRTANGISCIRKAKALIIDRPIFGNCTGPFSMAGRLMDVNEILLLCIEEPELVHTVLEKTTEFCINYIRAQKEAGANGMIMAEPLAGLLSYDLMEEFSSAYVRRIINELQDENFIFLYHNCANAIESKVDQLATLGAKMYHFGDKADMFTLLEKMPKDVIIMGNISPSATFNGGNADKVRRETQKLLRPAMVNNNFIISSGCDIPYDTRLENIEAFFDTVKLGYYKVYLWDIIDKL